MTRSAASRASGPLRIAVIGFGAIAEMHVRALAELRDRVELVAYSGGSPARAAELLRDAGWQDAVRSEPLAIIDDDDIDLVLIAAPSGVHGSLALAALRRGKHVVVEKPMAIDVHEAETIDLLARRSGLVVSVISQRRFEPEHAYVKQLLADGLLGEVVLATTQVPWYRDDAYFAAAPWRSQIASGGGSLMNQGVHNVDLLEWLCGPVQSVTAQSVVRPRSGDTDATMVATVRFGSGAVGTIVTTTEAFPGDSATVSIFTTKGQVVLGQGEVLRWDVDAPPPPSGAPVGHGGSDPLAIGHVGHLRQWRDVVDAVDSGRAPAIGSSDGLRTVRLLCGIHEAARTGRRVDLLPAPAGARATAPDRETGTSR